MKVVASFKLNKNLEKAIAELENFGIDRKRILALPLVSMAEREMNVPNQKILFETAPILGAIFMLLGTIYGFVLFLGPILWGLFGLVLGLITGIIIDLVRVKKRRKKEIYEEGKLTEVFLLVHCFDKDQALFVKEKLWKHLPMGVSTFMADSEGESYQ
jgi:hypothetical protein